MLRPLLKTLVALPFVVVAACGGGEAALPEESSLYVAGPDDAELGAQALCADGDANFKDRLQKEIEELNEAARPYVVMYKLARRAARASEGGSVERKYEGPRGTLTIAAAEQDDGSTLITVTAQKKGDDATARKLLEGTVAADGLSGTWKVLNRAGETVRTITWSKTEAGEFQSQWKNEKNGKTATYKRTATEGSIELVNPSGEKVTATWNLETKAGRVTVASPSGNTNEKCWDASLCNTECAAN